MYDGLIIFHGDEGGTVEHPLDPSHLPWLHDLLPVHYVEEVQLGVSLIKHWSYLIGLISQSNSSPMPGDIH